MILKKKEEKKDEEKKTILASLRTLLPLLRRAWCSVCCDPLQDSIASVCGATASITVAAPLDVIKTRIQSGREGGKGGVQLIKELVRQEGLGGFFRGLWPKVRSSEAGTGEGNLWLRTLDFRIARVLIILSKSKILLTNSSLVFIGSLCFVLVSFLSAPRGGSQAGLQLHRGPTAHQHVRSQDPRTPISALLRRLPSKFQFCGLCVCIIKPRWRMIFNAQPFLLLDYFPPGRTGRSMHVTDMRRLTGFVVPCSMGLSDGALS